jgi:hypothetical protein
MVKGNQVHLSGDQKKWICQLKAKDPGLTQQKLIERVEKEFRVKPSIAAIQRCLKDKEKILGASKTQLAKKKQTGAKFPKLEEAVDVWFCQVSFTTSRSMQLQLRSLVVLTILKQCWFLI